MRATDREQELAARIPLQDPAFYDQDLDTIDAALRAVRREAPVLWHGPGGFWVLLEHEDQRFVGTNPQMFSSRFGFQIADTYQPEKVMAALAPWAQDRLGAGGLTPAEQRGLIARAKVSMGDPDIVSIVVTDPPRHQELRRIMTNAMSPRLMRSIEPTIARIVESALDRVSPGETAEFVSTVAAPIPPLVIAALLSLRGLPALGGRVHGRDHAHRARARRGEPPSRSAAGGLHR
jgi:cytochrome P450